MRKLTARSAILSALLGAHPAQAPVAWIVRVALELGLQESAVRVALTRMVAAGDLERGDGTYRLSARLIDRQRRQDEAVRPRQRDWDGGWHLAVVTVGADDSTARAALREAMAVARFGELREGVWTRPDNIAVTLDSTTLRRVALFNAVPQEPAVDLAERLFAPERWSRRADELLAASAAATAMSDRFTIAAAMVRHLLADPLLPDQLTPRPWPGPDLRAAYEVFREEFTAFAEGLLTDA